MPRGDRTGPEGFGPMTGRADGYCAGFEGPGYMNARQGGRGLGFGRREGYFSRGYGRGRGLGFQARRRRPDEPYAALPKYPEEMTREDELAALKNQMKYMEEDIKAAEKRMAELEKEE